MKRYLCWFICASFNKIPIIGHLIQKKLQVVASLDIKNFKASNGSLENFRTRNNIKHPSICEQAAGVNIITLKSKICTGEKIAKE